MIVCTTASNHDQTSLMFIYLLDSLEFYSLFSPLITVGKSQLRLAPTIKRHVHHGVSRILQTVTRLRFKDDSSFIDSLSIMFHCISQAVEHDSGPERRSIPGYYPSQQAA